VHTNTIAIFLIEITTNECLKSYNNLLYYSLKCGKTAQCGNLSFIMFIAKNLHLIESKDRESSVIQTGSILNSILGVHWSRESSVIQTGSILNSILGVHWSLFVTSAHSRQAGSSKDRPPGVPGIGGEKVKGLLQCCVENTPGQYIQFA
jgi:hypothetical protein